MLRGIEILEPGFRTTVEDLGRPGASLFGVPPGGAFDSFALRRLNHLLGNEPGAALLEIWMRGPLLFNYGEEPIAIVLVGMGFAWRLTRDGLPRQMDTDQVLRLRPGERLAIEAPAAGGRAWLALAGGIEVPTVLGSRSTCVASGFGGFQGRALRAADRLVLGPQPSPTRIKRPPAFGETLPAGDETAVVLRLLEGPQIGLLTAGARAYLTEIDWKVSPACDRIGVRLVPLVACERSRLAHLPEIEPEATTLGAMQIPPDGNPVLLGPDRPTTGGYAKPALVAQIDVQRLARLVPGRRVRFAWLSLEEATRLLHERRLALR